MRRSALAIVAVAVLAALAACGDGDQPSSTTATTEARTVDETTPLTWDGFGPIEAGLTLREAQEAAGVELVPREFEAFGHACYHAVVTGLEGRVLLTVLTPDVERPVDDPFDGVVQAATALEAETDRGIGVGATEAEVEAAYGDLGVERSQHHYVEAGSYLDVRDPDDPSRLLRFETDGEHVTTIHGGHESAATLVEGCA